MTSTATTSTGMPAKRPTAMLLGLLALLSGLAGCKSVAAQSASPRPHARPRHRATATATASAKKRRPPPTPTVDPFWGRPVVSEDFTGAALDPRKWVVYDSPDAKDNPRTKAATTVSGGALHLTGGLYQGKDLSGGVASTLLQTYGRWEVRLRADAGVGYSAVALLWPEHMGGPEYAEIDFAELIDPTRQTGGIFVHYGPADTQAEHLTRTDFTRWHTVAVDWLPDRLTFWLDGKAVWTYHGPLIPHRDRMGLALQNDQVCDLGPRFCRDRTTPPWVHMDVDRVRIYRAPARTGQPQ